MPTCMNWPPSRGPKPECKTEYVIPDIERRDAAVEPSLERAIIEAALAGVKDDTDIEHDPIEGEGEEEASEDEGDLPEMTERMHEAMRQFGRMLGERIATGDDRESIVDATREVERRIRRGDEEALAMFAPRWSEATAYCNVHLETLAQLTLAQAERLVFPFRPNGPSPDDLPALPLIARISYPLSRAVDVTIRPYTKKTASEEGDGETWPRMTFAYVAWVIAKEYERIYAAHEHYGVWGHALDDLWLEGLHIAADGTATLAVGS